MRLIDEEYTRTPFYGWLRMTAYLREDKGYAVNHKRVQRLMQVMGLQALYPKPRTTLPGSGARLHPYLLRGLAIKHPDQVWSAERTFGWLGRYRRLARDYEHTFAVSEAITYLANTRRMLKLLTN